MKYYVDMVIHSRFIIIFFFQTRPSQISPTESQTVLSSELSKILRDSLTSIYNTVALNAKIVIAQLKANNIFLKIAMDIFGDSA